ncbi:LuxR C-terminal-related transcriptional regulator [Streptomyces sp. NPDC090106]|uniref:LuxR C-terminal-related transcriptional regulator n=1 Tax=Streptomyces sp. NPDC090106 TaxID=3365946 RepID=UPI0037F57EDC
MEKNRMVSVLVVHNQSLHRLALRMLLTAEPELTVVAEAASGADAVALNTALHPDVVLMDSRLAARDDITAIRRITRPAPLPQALEPIGRRQPSAHVLALTPAGEHEYAYVALRAGAAGVLHEDADPSQLVAAIRTVAKGDGVITPTLTRALIDTVCRQHTSRFREGSVGIDAFTAREREVLIGVAAGWSNVEIAARLFIAPTTVKSHVSRILSKIGATARVQAVTFAYESGLVRPATLAGRTGATGAS